MQLMFTKRTLRGSFQLDTFSFLVCALTLWNFIMILKNWKVVCIKTATLVTLLKNELRRNKQNTGTKTIVSRKPKKEAVIAFQYLGKSSLQICPNINHVMENKLTVIFRLFSKLSAKLVTFFTFIKQNSIVFMFCNCL